MKALDFAKLILLSVALSRTHLFADIYTLEVKKDKQTIRFIVEDLTHKCTDSFSVRKVDNSYESGDWSFGGYMEGITVGTGVAFDF